MLARITQHILLSAISHYNCYASHSAGPSYICRQTIFMLSALTVVLDLHFHVAARTSIRSTSSLFSRAALFCDSEDDASVSLQSFSILESRIINHILWKANGGDCDGQGFGACYFEDDGAWNETQLARVQSSIGRSCWKKTTAARSSKITEDLMEWWTIMLQIDHWSAHVCCQSGWAARPAARTHSHALSYCEHRIWYRQR